MLDDIAVSTVNDDGRRVAEEELIAKRLKGASAAEEGHEAAKSEDTSSVTISLHTEDVVDGAHDETKGIQSCGTEVAVSSKAKLSEGDKQLKEMPDTDVASGPQALRMLLKGKTSSIPKSLQATTSSGERNMNMNDMSTASHLNRKMDSPSRKESMSSAAVAEKQRRDRINELLRDFRMLVPGAQRCDKTRLIELAIKYLAGLVARKLHLVTGLEAKVVWLESNLGITETSDKKAKVRCGTYVNCLSSLRHHSSCPLLCYMLKIAMPTCELLAECERDVQDTL